MTTSFRNIKDKAGYCLHDSRADISDTTSVYVAADKWGTVSITFTDGRSTMRRELTAEQARAIAE